jgi:hypothetical protein
MTNLLAAETTIGNFTGIGPYGNPPGPLSAIQSFMGIISSIIGLLTILGGLWFLFQIILGGLRWISSGGDKQANQEAQKRITNALMGIIIVIFAYAFTGLIGLIFGLETIDVGGLIANKIHP